MGVTGSRRTRVAGKTGNRRRDGRKGRGIRSDLGANPVARYLGHACAAQNDGDRTQQRTDGDDNGHGTSIAIVAVARSSVRANKNPITGTDTRGE